MNSTTQRHKRIASLQARVLAIVVGVLVSLTAMSGIKQAYDHHVSNNQAETVARRNEFWQIIARQKSPNASNVKNSFAITLRDKLGEQDSKAVTLPREIEEFRAGPNAFGGIESELGFVPFDNTGQQCTICGSLSSDMKTKLLQIKQGNLSTVLGQEEATIGDVSWHLTPYDMNMLLWLAFVYTGSTIGAIMFAVRRDSHNHNYRASLLDWQYDGGSQADTYRRLSKQVSPLYFMTVLPLQRKLSKEKTHAEVLEAIGLASSDAKLRSALTQIDALPLSQQDDLEVVRQRELIESLLDQIDHQVNNYNNTGDLSPVVSHSIESIQMLTRDASDAINSRSAAIGEIEQTDTQARGRNSYP